MIFTGSTLPPGVLPYSLGGGVPLGSRKSNPLLCRPNFASFMTLQYTRLKMLNCSRFQSFANDPVKRDPILDQFSVITRPYMCTRLVKWLENHTLSSATYQYNQYMGVLPQAPSNSKLRLLTYYSTCIILYTIRSYIW